MKKIAYLLVFIILAISCNESADYEPHEDHSSVEASEDIYEDESMSFKADDNGYSTTSYFAATSVGSQGMARQAPLKPSITLRKMIWSANLRLQVSNVDSSSRAIEKLIAEHGGFISKMDLTTSKNRITNTIQLRVTNDHFQDLVGEIKGLAEWVEEVRINSNDVTEEFVDIQSRLKTKKEVRDRYIEVLRNKTGDVKDIIQAEEAIRVITEEIEAKEGRLRFLKDRVKYSTLSVSIYERIEEPQIPLVAKDSYGTKLADGLGNGWSIITGFILILANIWPLALIIGLLIWKGGWMMKRLSS